MKNYVHLLFLLGLMLAGCAPSAESDSSPTLVAATTGASATPTPSAISPEVPLARLWRAAGHPVIYQGTMELEVADFLATSARLDSVLLRHGAYLTAAHETTDADRHQQTLTLRMPSAHFLALTTDLARLGIVRQKELTSRDITTELAQLHQAPPISPTDTSAKLPLAPEAQLLTEQAALATLHLSYFQLRPTAETAPAAAIAPQLTAGLWFGWRILGAVLIGAAYVWPLLVAGASWAAYQRYLHRKVPAA